METQEATVEGRIAEDLERAQTATPDASAEDLRRAHITHELEDVAGEQNDQDDAPDTDPLADLPQRTAEEVRRLQHQVDAADMARDLVRQISDAKRTGRPVPVMDTITLKWFCSCGAQAVGTFTPSIYEVIAVVWDMQHTGPDARGFEHYLTTEAICKEARHRGNRPPFSVQLTLDSLTRL